MNKNPKVPRTNQRPGIGRCRGGLTHALVDSLSQTALLTAEVDLHRAEPETLRYRLLHTAARITRGQRNVFLRLAEQWPWALALARAFQRLRLIPLPA